MFIGLIPADSWYKGKRVNNIENHNSFTIVDVVLNYREENTNMK